MSPMLRADGFPGQHMIVLPLTVVRESENDPTIRGLFPTDAGHFLKTEGHVVKRPAGAVSDICIVCIRGAGWVRLRGRLWNVEAGGVVLIRRGESHEYGADEADPWEIEWVHWTGEENEAWWKLVEPFDETPVLQFRAEEVARLNLRRIWQTLEQGLRPINLVIASAALRLALAQLAQLKSTVLIAKGRGGSGSAEAVTETITWLHENPRLRARVPELAARARLSTAHYTELFRQQTGMAPLEYGIRLKMQSATRLLNTTPLPVKEIADYLGYEDPLYFSRVFTEYVGVSPRAYRKIPKG